MLAFWPDVIRPLLEALEPEAVVEIGSESGKTTRRLLELAHERSFVVHAIDPAPTFDVGPLVEAYGQELVFHCDISLAAIARIGRIDAALIDGDHNWYTVHSELTLLESCARALGQPPPLLLLHDVAWPYGRRDLYYEPDRIPAEHRQPYAKRGISPTARALLDRGGFNAHLCNALNEGGPKNGVLTAVEDYLKASHEPFVVATIPAVFGLAILLPQARARRRPLLLERVRVWCVPEVQRFIDRMEMARIAMLTGTLP